MVRFLFVSLSCAVLASCAKPEKEFQPIVAKIGDTVKAISHEEAETVCKTNYCEQNQIYVADFGRRRRDPDPTPVPTKTPDPTPSPTTPTGPQPTEKLDYSRALLNLKDAWEMNEGSPEVIVAVIDSGVEYTHPDLKDNIWKNTAELNGQPGKDDDGNGYVDDVYGWDFYNDRPNGFDDGNGHGTHCAGIIAAAKNSIGTRGVAPKVKIMPLKFLSKAGSGDTADAIRAIDYAVKNGARVLSNSWGGGGYSSLLRDAVNRANAAGKIFVAAAGNESNNNDSTSRYPASYDGVYAVGSSDSGDKKSSFSNYGADSVFIFAPGSNIYSTYLSGKYTTMSGTSMAAPQVSGAFALGASYRASATNNDLEKALCDSSVQKLTSYSQCGRMDVAAFLRRL